MFAERLNFHLSIKIRTLRLHSMDALIISHCRIRKYGCISSGKKKGTDEEKKRNSLVASGIQKGHNSYIALQSGWADSISVLGLAVDILVDVCDAAAIMSGEILFARFHRLVNMIGLIRHATSDPWKKNKLVRDTSPGQRR